MPASRPRDPESPHFLGRPRGCPSASQGSSVSTWLPTHFPGVQCFAPIRDPSLAEEGGRPMSRPHWTGPGARLRRGAGWPEWAALEEAAGQDGGGRG